MKKILVFISLFFCFALSGQNLIDSTRPPTPFQGGIVIGNYNNLPVGAHAGQIVWYIPEGKFYQYNGTEWETLQVFAAEDLDSTQTINIGDIGNNTIENGFNAFTFTGADDPVQDQADGYVIINCIRNGTNEQYLFLGQGGNYGVTGTETATSDDFTLVDQNVPFQDVWRNDAGNQAAISYDQNIRHNGNVTVNKRLIVGGSNAYGIYNTGTSDLWLQGNQGVNIVATNQNVGNINLITSGLLTSRPSDDTSKYNVRASRNFSDNYDTNNFKGINLWLNNTVDFTAKTGNSYHTSLLIDPDIQDTGINHKAIDVIDGLVDIQSGKLKVSDYTFPNADGTANQVLTTDGNGQLIWENVSDIDNTITKTLINASSVTLLAADVENFNQFIIDPSQTNVTITIPPTVNPGGMLFLNIYHEGTGNITVQAGSGVTFTTRTFTNIKRVVLYSDTDDVWKVKEENTQNSSGGSDSITWQTEITTDTTFNGTQKGAFNFYPVNSTNPVVITLDKGTYAVGDVVVLNRRGSGAVEIVRGTDVRLNGRRNINNQFFINDVGSDAFVQFSHLEGSTLVGNVIGNITGGYTGAVTTTNYDNLREGDTNTDILVTGTGFSENMIVSVSANATLNSWTFNSNTSITLNLDAVGLENDTVTITYDNGDIFSDTDAITIQASVTSYSDYIAWWKMDETSGSTMNDQSTNYNGTINGATINQTGKIAQSYTLDGVDDYVSVSGNPITAFPFTFKTWVKNANLSNVKRIYCSTDNLSHAGLNVNILTDGAVQVTLGDGGGGGVSNRKTYQTGTGKITTATWQSIVVVFTDFNTCKIYVDNVDETLSNSGSATTVEFNTTYEFGTYRRTNEFTDFDLDDTAIWDRALTPTEINTIYTLENSGNEML